MRIKNILQDCPLSMNEGRIFVSLKSMLKSAFLRNVVVLMTGTA